MRHGGAARIKRAYEVIAQQVGMVWKGRRFDRQDHDATDLLNQAINHAVTALEAAVTIAVHATATLPPLGLYRTTVTVPLAFRCAKTYQQRADQTLDWLCHRAVNRHVRETGFVDAVIDDVKEMLA